jgi:hypothetical protein
MKHYVKAFCIVSFLTFPIHANPPKSSSKKAPHTETIIGLAGGCIALLTAYIVYKNTALTNQQHKRESQLALLKILQEREQKSEPAAEKEKTRVHIDQLLEQLTRNA